MSWSFDNLVNFRSHDTSFTTTSLFHGLPNYRATVSTAIYASALPVFTFELQGAVSDSGQEDEDADKMLVWDVEEEERQ